MVREKHISFYILFALLLGILTAIRNISSLLQYSVLVAIWICVFGILHVCCSGTDKKHYMIDMLYMISTFGIAVQCLLGSEGLLKTSFLFRLISYPAAVILALIIYLITRKIVFRIPAPVLAAMMFVLQITLLIIICTFGVKEYGTIKSFVIFGQSLQLTVLTKLIAVIFYAAIIRIYGLSENQKMILIVGFTAICMLFFIYMNELGTFMLIFLLHLAVIARFIPSSCSFRRIYLTGCLLSVLASAAFILLVIPHFGTNNPVFAKLYIRLLGVIDPSQLDPSGNGYSQAAARKALLVGGAFGSSLNLHIPEANTDLVFSYIFLRFGIVISMIMMTLYSQMLSSSLLISSEKAGISECISYESAMALFIQATYNIAMALGILPICGINLIFISSGTMELLFGFIMFFFIVDPASRRRR